jgi:arsenate reductase (thioredoxin)
MKLKSKTNKKVLFVCIENAGRSQMAEAFFRKYVTDNYEAASAGTRHTSEINPLAVQVMKEVGIDISKQKPKEITEDMIKNATKIINMGCMDKNACPALFVYNIIDWEIEDPRDKPIEKVIEIRDGIEKRIEELVKEIKKEEEME